MRPIKLKIKGLNSFIEEQLIDFEKLTDRGLFGIFGPTGSGKSTVLDGITLALYGEVARKSSNFINTNCESANVSFEFQISGKEKKRYLVEREFKTDKKTGNPRSGKCKVMDITGGEPIILADSVSKVTSTCKEIIGLNIEDFTRTVVLPQGKFSEFLKLEGKSRRDMLERLFNLQEYGDDLSRKLSIEISREKTENSVLIGELKGYEDISEEKRNLKLNELSDIETKLKHAVIELENIDKEYKENEELWKMQIDLSEHMKVKDELKQKEAKVNECIENVRLSEKSYKVKPYIDSYEKTILDIREHEKHQEIIKNELDKVKEYKKKIEEDYKTYKEKKENILPTLTLKHQTAKDALEEEKVLKALEKEIKSLEDNIIISIEKEDKSKEQIDLLDNKIKEITVNINEKEEEIEKLKVDKETKQKVYTGVKLEEKLNDILSKEKDVKKKKVEFENEIEKEKSEWKALESNLKITQNSLENSKIELEKILRECPGNQEDLLKLQSEKVSAKEKWNKYEDFTEEIKSSKKKIEDLLSSVNKNTLEKEELIKSIDIIKKSLKDIETENLAHKLRESLESGEACPVCGSVDHHIENIKAVEVKDIISEENNLNLKESELKNIEGNITICNTNIDILTNKIKDLENQILALGEDFKLTTLEDLENKFNSLQKALGEYDNRKQSFEDEINRLKSEEAMISEKINSKMDIVSRTEKLLININVEYEENEKNLCENESIYSNLIKETGIENFTEKHNQILEIENIREDLINKVKLSRENLENSTSLLKTLGNEQSLLKQEIVKQKTTLSEKKSNKLEKISCIKSKVGDVEDIVALISHIEGEIKNIEENFSKVDKLKEQTEKNFNEINERFIEAITSLTNLNKRRETENEALSRALSENEFTSAAQAKSKLIEESYMKRLKDAIEDYKNKLARAEGAIEATKKKIGNRHLEKETWESIQENKKNKSLEKDELKKQSINLSKEVEDINKKLNELSDLLDKKKKLDHKMSILSDLEKLFKGKKFVEYVASTRLKYISIEASKKLKDITNGNYGLEVDEDGRFIIRDYKNGGAARDASTLSGGETFLTSLALALSLSSEIQLKGTAPLELFFLDEGFGTLDDNLLEVVMSSLEGIHHDKLKVGIISHVESIKNRVPVKLILTPAESGRGGSKVKIERS